MSVPFLERKKNYNDCKNKENSTFQSAFSTKTSTWPVMLNKNLWIKIMYRR